VRESVKVLPVTNTIILFTQVRLPVQKLCWRFWHCGGFGTAELKGKAFSTVQRFWM